MEDQAFRSFRGFLRRLQGHIWQVLCASSVRHALTTQRYLSVCVMSGQSSTQADHESSSWALPGDTVDVERPAGPSPGTAPALCPRPACATGAAPSPPTACPSPPAPRPADRRPVGADSECRGAGEGRRGPAARGAGPSGGQAVSPGQPPTAAAATPPAPAAAPPHGLSESIGRSKRLCRASCCCKHTRVGIRL